MAQNPTQSAPSTGPNDHNQKSLHQSVASNESSEATTQQQNTVNAQQPSAIGIQQPDSTSLPTITNENGKRTLDEDDMTGGNDFKRLNTSGPPALKT
jgi:hypothetical protein